MPAHMGGTRIGHALNAVRERLRRREEGDRMIVLISDGMSADLGGGVGQKIGQELAADNIANLTGGQAFAAGDPQALAEVFKRIDAMAPTKTRPSAPQPADWFWPFAVTGLGLLGLKVVSSLGLRFTPW